MYWPGGLNSLYTLICKKELISSIHPLKKARVRMFSSKSYSSWFNIFGIKYYLSDNVSFTFHRTGGHSCNEEECGGVSFRLSVFIPKDLWPNSFNPHWGSLLESTIALGAETGDFLIFWSHLHCLVCKKRALPLPLWPPASPIPLLMYQHRLKDFPCVVIHCSPCSLWHSGVAGVPLWPG